MANTFELIAKLVDQVSPGLKGIGGEIDQVAAKM